MDIETGLEWEHREQGLEQALDQAAQEGIQREQRLGLRTKRSGQLVQ